jgi:hypothetical protein
VCAAFFSLVTRARYEVEFGVSDAVARFTSILKDKIQKPTAAGKDATKVISDKTGDSKGMSQPVVAGGSGKNGVGDGAAAAVQDISHGISVDDVVAAEKILDQVKPRDFWCCLCRCTSSFPAFYVQYSVGDRAIQREHGRDRIVSAFPYIVLSFHFASSVFLCCLQNCSRFSYISVLGDTSDVQICVDLQSARVQFERKLATGRRHHGQVSHLAFLLLIMRRLNDHEKIMLYDKHSTSDLCTIQHEREWNWLADYAARRFICRSAHCGRKLAQVHPIRRRWWGDAHYSPSPIWKCDACNICYDFSYGLGDRVLKQQRIQELTDMLLQIDENISMLSEVLTTISSMTCHSLRWVAREDRLPRVGTRTAPLQLIRLSLHCILLFISLRYDPPNTKAKRLQNLKQRYPCCDAVSHWLQAFLIEHIRFGQISQFAQSAAVGDAPSSGASTASAKPVQVTPQKLSRCWAARHITYLAFDALTNLKFKTFSPALLQAFCQESFVRRLPRVLRQKLQAKMEFEEPPIWRGDVEGMKEGGGGGGGGLHWKTEG